MLFRSIVLGKGGSGDLAMAGKTQPPPVVRFVDNGDGTVTDTRTGLMWEQKTGTYNADGIVVCTGFNCPDPRNVNNVYPWTPTTPPYDGVLLDFLAKINCTAFMPGGRCGPGLYRDWRIPTIAELQTIADCSFRGCIDPIFGPTAASFSWSSSVRADFNALVWGVSFEDGTAWPTDKSNAAYVRAVRGGS